MGAKPTGESRFEFRPPESDSVNSTVALTTRLSGPCHRLYTIGFVRRANFIEMSEQLRPFKKEDVKSGRGT